jgi:hypothetical protein
VHGRISASEANPRWIGVENRRKHMEGKKWLRWAALITIGLAAYSWMGALDLMEVLKDWALPAIASAAVISWAEFLTEDESAVLTHWLVWIIAIVVLLGFSGIFLGSGFASYFVVEVWAKLVLSAAVMYFLVPLSEKITAA